MIASAVDSLCLCMITDTSGLSGKTLLRESTTGRTAICQSVHSQCGIISPLCLCPINCHCHQIPENFRGVRALSKVQSMRPIALRASSFLPASLRTEDRTARANLCLASSSDPLPSAPKPLFALRAARLRVVTAGGTLPAPPYPTCVKYEHINPQIPYHFIRNYAIFASSRHGKGIPLLHLLGAIKVSRRIGIC